MTYDVERPSIMRAHRHSLRPWWAKHFFPAAMLWLTGGFVVILAIAFVALWCGVSDADGIEANPAVL